MVYIPKLLCTQHPDSTVRVPAQLEVQEALLAFTAYGCDEVMVDYEGKLTPYTQPREIVAQALNQGVEIGESRFVTVRLPNPKLEGDERLVLALIAALTANMISLREMGTQAVHWVVLPMLDNTRVLRETHRLALRLSNTLLSEGTGTPQVIPLLESLESMLRVKEYLYAVAELHDKEDRHRIFLGASDAAVASGHVASSLAIRYALSEIASEGDSSGGFAPILGMGRPPFRGGINDPDLAVSEAKQYAGYHTVTVQSAIRYDADSASYQRFLDAVLSQQHSGAENTSESVIEMIREAELHYRKTLVKISRIVLDYSRAIPQTRDRLVWPEYGRRLRVDDMELKLPRAIPFTAACYTLGLPPAFLDAFFILRAHGKGLLGKLLDLLPSLPLEWERDAEFFVPNSVAKIFGQEFLEVIRKAMRLLNVEEHENEVYVALLNQPPSELVVLAAARWRGFLG